MNEIKSTGDAAAFARGSAGDYKAAIDLCTEDGRLRRFKYLLERLTVGGLRMDEVPPLRKVGEAVFGGKDTSAAAAYCGSMKPEFSPVSFMSNFGSLTSPKVSPPRSK